VKAAKVLDFLSFIKYLPFIFCLILFRPFQVYLYYFEKKKYVQSCQCLAKFLLFICGIKLIISGKDLIAKLGERFIIISNHQSFIDIAIILSIYPATFIQRPVGYLPGVSWHFGKLSLIIDRDKPSSILRMIQFINNTTVDSGIPVAVFPESTRSIDGKLGNLHIGAAFTAKKLNLPVLPITIYNSREIMGRENINIKSGKVYVKISEMIDEDYIKNHPAKEINERFRQKLQSGLDYLSQCQKESL